MQCVLEFRNKGEEASRRGSFCVCSRDEAKCWHERHSKQEVVLIRGYNTTAVFRVTGTVTAVCRQNVSVFTGKGRICGCRVE